MKALFSKLCWNSVRELMVAEIHAHDDASTEWALSATACGRTEAYAKRWNDDITQSTSWIFEKLSYAIAQVIAQKV